MVTIITKDLVIMEDGSLYVEFWPVICIFKRSMQKLCDEYRRSGFYWEVYVSFIFLCYSLNIYLPDKFPWLKMFHIMYINQLYVALTSCFTHTHTHTHFSCYWSILASSKMSYDFMQTPSC